MMRGQASNKKDVPGSCTSMKQSKQQLDMQRLLVQLSAARAEVQNLRRLVSERETKCKLDYRSKLQAERLKWTASKEQALANQRRLFEEKLSKALRAKEREVNHQMKIKEREAMKNFTPPTDRPLPHLRPTPYVIGPTPKVQGKCKIGRPLLCVNSFDSDTSSSGFSSSVETRCTRSVNNNRRNNNTNNMSAIMSTSFTLPRSPKVSISTPAKAGLGGISVVTKDEHERERHRWVSKIEEIEVRLMEAETSNSDMNQIKAELNKRIVELERGQRPLIEQNRKLNDRNRLLQQEAKKAEERLRHAQDDYLSLKDIFERVNKENALLKEKRMYPEKLEELERYRTQVLEYSKCITALRQTGTEKDRRYDLLAQKFRRLRKCLSSRNADNTEEDKQSSYGGSDCSVSSFSLDTITEDLDESISNDIESNYQQLAKEHQELQKTLCSLRMNSAAANHWRQNEANLREQLNAANARVYEMERLLQADAKDEKTPLLAATIDAQREQLIGLQARSERLERELLDQKDQNELLEFQVLELQETSKHEKQQLQESLLIESNKTSLPDTSDQATFTEEDDASQTNEEDNTTLSNADIKMRLTLLKHRRWLKSEDRCAIKQAKDLLDLMDEQLAGWEQEKLDWQQKLTEAGKQHSDELDTIKERVAEKVMRDEQLSRNELQAEIAKLEQSINNYESGKQNYHKELENFKVQLRRKEEEAATERVKCGDLSRKLTQLADSRKCEIEMMEDNSRRHSLELSSLRDQLELVKQANDKLIDEKEQLTAEVTNARNTVEDAKLELALSRNEQQARAMAASDTVAGIVEMERKYADAKQRLKEALKLVHDYELAINKVQNRCSHLEARLKAATSHGSTELNAENNQALLAQLVQSKSYNHQMEQQFAVQLQIVESLKAELLKRKTASDLFQLLQETCNTSNDGNNAITVEKCSEICAELKSMDNMPGKSESNLVNGLVTMFKQCGRILEKTNSKERLCRVQDKQRGRPTHVTLSGESGWWSNPSSSEAMTSPEEEARSGSADEGQDSQSDSGIAPVPYQIKQRNRKHKTASRRNNQQDTRNGSIPLQHVTTIQPFAQHPPQVATRSTIEDQQDRDQLF